MRNERYNHFYRAGKSARQDGQSFRPPTDDSDAHAAYEAGWDDVVALEEKPEEDGWKLLLATGAAAVVAVGVLAAFAKGPPPASMSRATRSPVLEYSKHCSWQWQYTGKWLSNNDQTWRREWYYTGNGFLGYDGLWHRGWRYTGRWLPNNDGTSRREQKQYWICS